MSRMNNDEFIAYATKRYIAVKKTRDDIVKLYHELKQILNNYWNFGVISIQDYTDLLSTIAELYSYFYEVALFRAEKY